METLRLSENKKLTQFEQYLNADGEWCSALGNYELQIIKQIDYRSNKYDYYIAEDTSGEHTILRNKK